MDIEDLLISSRFPSGQKNYKYFIGYINDSKMEPFATILTKTSAYIKSYDSGATKWMYFLIGDGELLQIVIVFGTV